ncbi:MAG TPA: DUF1657 domain-containing protein [Firmicutes bacterium]|nr:DUF1657 domain-containing protein [Bacillota bacterium]
MTVGEKLHMTLTNLEAAKANLEQFGLDTQDQTAQKMYFEMATELGNMIQAFKGRVNYTESQEPQYKVRQQAMSPQQRPRP